jgi:hypothetical protein
MIIRPLPLDEVVDRRVALELLAGSGIGLAAGAGICWHWFRQGSGTSLNVLGCGDLLSVLITHQRRRILIAAGTSSAAFSQLLSPLLPLVGGRIDLLLIDPRSGAEVIGHAQKLDSREMIWLPSERFGREDDVLRARSRVQGDDGFTLVLDPGIGGNWQATVVWNGERATIVPGELPSVASGQLVLSVGGARDLPERRPFVITPSEVPDDSRARSVDEGRQVRIRLTRDEARITS